MNNFVTHLECSEAGDHYNFAEINNLSKINKPLLVKYDLEKLKNSFSKEDFINDFEKLFFSFSKSYFTSKGLLNMI